jgi:hypothetical protein
MNEVDLEGALNAGAYHPDGTSSSYSTYLKKFAAFVDCEPYVIGDMTTIPIKEHFNDVTLAKFFLVLGRSNDFKPHFKKSGLAAINFGVIHHALPNIFQFHHAYPKLHQVLKLWDCHLKVHPYHVTKGESFDCEGVAAILALTNSTDIELRDQAATLVSLFTALRTVDIDRANTEDWKMCPADANNPRHFLLSRSQTKNDLKGIGNLSNLSSHLPCICLVGIDKAAKKKFLSVMKKDPFCPCNGPCPFRT